MLVPPGKELPLPPAPPCPPPGPLLVVFPLGPPGPLPLPPTTPVYPRPSIYTVAPDCSLKSPLVRRLIIYCLELVLAVWVNFPPVFTNTEEKVIGTELFCSKTALLLMISAPAFAVPVESFKVGLFTPPRVRVLKLIGSEAAVTTTFASIVTSSKAPGTALPLQFEGVDQLPFPPEPVQLMEAAYELVYNAKDNNIHATPAVIGLRRQHNCILRSITIIRANTISR